MKYCLVWILLIVSSIKKFVWQRAPNKFLIKVPVRTRSLNLNQFVKEIVKLSLEKT